MTGDLLVLVSMRKLPRNRAGYIVPWFVAYVNGEPDFRIMDPAKFMRAMQFQLCWLCGEKIEHVLDSAFVIGPMCAVNRTSAEPPSHLICAQYAVRECPFLSRPNMRRRDRGKEHMVKAPGLMLERNPGVTLLWTSSARPYRTDHWYLFELGSPLAVFWYAEGRPATRAEVLASIDSGLPALLRVAEEDGPEDVAALEQMYQQALTLIPAA